MHWLRILLLLSLLGTAVSLDERAALSKQLKSTQTANDRVISDQMFEAADVVIAHLIHLEKANLTTLQALEEMKAEHWRTWTFSIPWFLGISGALQQDIKTTEALLEDRTRIFSELEKEVKEQEPRAYLEYVGEQLKELEKRPTEDIPFDGVRRVLETRVAELEEAKNTLSEEKGYYYQHWKDWRNATSAMMKQNLDLEQTHLKSAKRNASRAMHRFREYFLIARGMFSHSGRMALVSFEESLLGSKGVSLYVLKSQYERDDIDPAQKEILGRQLEYRKRVNEKRPTGFVPANYIPEYRYIRRDMIAEKYPMIKEPPEYLTAYLDAREGLSGRLQIAELCAGVLRILATWTRFLFLIAACLLAPIALFADIQSIRACSRRFLKTDKIVAFVFFLFSQVGTLFRLMISVKRNQRF